MATIYGENKMKQVFFQKIGMKNFCNHIDPVEITMVNGQLVLVTGPNGSGKTSMFQALPYALYGQCEKGRGEDVLNDKTRKNCHVWVEFLIGDDTYRVDRYVKYTRLGNTVTLKKNDVVTHKGHKEVVPEIENLLVPYKLFTNTLLFGQKVKTFFTDLTDSEQKEIFRRILKLDDYVLYYKEAADRFKAVDDLIQRTVNQISVQTSLITTTAAQIEAQKEEERKYYETQEKELKDLQIINSMLQTKVSDLERNLENTAIAEAQLQTISELLTEASREYASLVAELNDQKQKIQTRAEATKAGMDKDAEQAKREIIQSNQKKQEEITSRFGEKIRDIESQISLITSDRHELEVVTASQYSDIKGFETQISDLRIDPKMIVCPTCHQKITKECVGHIDEKINQIQRKILATKTAIETNEEAHKRSTLEIELLETKKQKLESDRDEEYELNNEDETNMLVGIQERLTAAHGKLATMVKEAEADWERTMKDKEVNLGAQIISLTDQRDQLQKIVNERNIKHDELQAVKVELATNQESAANLKKQEFNKTLIESLEIKLEELKVQVQSLTDSRVGLDRENTMLKFWKGGFSPSGIQSMLIDEAIPFMNDKIAAYMYQLSNGRYSVTFDTLKATKAGEFRDKISVDVFDNTTHADARIKLSGGQERIVDIGTILTLCDLQSMIQDVEFNLLLFDEIFDALDDENIGFVANLIKMVSKNKWVGVISHRHIDQIEADEVLSFRG